ncbi:hypothetical protein LguiA_006856 [Lonicera macranthoides]
MFLVESKLISDQRVEASIKTIKYLKGPLGGSIGPQISPCILWRKDGASEEILRYEGFVMNLPCEQGVQK